MKRLWNWLAPGCSAFGSWRHWIGWVVSVSALLSAPGCSCQTYREVNGKTVRTSHFSIDGNGITSETVLVEGDDQRSCNHPGYIALTAFLWFVVGFFAGAVMASRKINATKH